MLAPVQCSTPAYTFLLINKHTAWTFLEEMREVGDGQQSQQWKDLVQVEVYYHLVFLILFPASANQVLPYSAASGLWCADGDSRALEPGRGSPSAISYQYFPSK